MDSEQIYPCLIERNTLTLAVGIGMIIFLTIAGATITVKIRKLQKLDCKASVPALTELSKMPLEFEGLPITAARVRRKKRN